MAKKSAKAKKTPKPTKAPKKAAKAKAAKKTPAKPQASSKSKKAKPKKTAAGAKLKVDPAELLKGMYADDYFPKFLVDKVKNVLLAMCREIESKKPADHASLCTITCRATDKINNLQEDFDENDSEIETMARDDIGMTFGYIAGVYGFADSDVEDLIATRDW